MTNEPKDKLNFKTKEELEAEVDKNMSLEQFEAELLKFNNLGATSVKKHQEMFPAPKKDDKGKDVPQGNKPYHAAGTDLKCLPCKLIIENHDRYMALQKEYFDFSGIPFDNLMAAIKVTVGVIRLIANTEAEDTKDGTNTK